MVEGRSEVIDKSLPLVTRASSQLMSGEGRKIKGEALPKAPLKLSKNGGYGRSRMETLKGVRGGVSRENNVSHLVGSQEMTTNQGVN